MTAPPDPTAASGLRRCPAPARNHTASARAPSPADRRRGPRSIRTASTCRPSVHPAPGFAAAGPGRAHPIEATGIRASAVLAPVYETGGVDPLVFTRRAHHLRSHRGEVSFPGGGHEAGDPDLAATALREAWEETRLDPDHVEVIGELDHLTTVSSTSFIVPVRGPAAAPPGAHRQPRRGRGDPARVAARPCSIRRSSGPSGGRSPASIGPSTSSTSPATRSGARQPPCW